MGRRDRILAPPIGYLSFFLAPFYGNRGTRYFLPELDQLWDVDRLLGVQIVSRSGSELIASAVAHMEYGGSAEDLARTIHAHPTLSESLKEAALSVDGRGLHSF